MEKEYMYKIVVVGMGAVGKTSIISRYWKNEFSEMAEPTIGVDFAHKDIVYKEAKITAQIWDTAGQERFRSVAAPYFRDAHGAILVYDVTTEESFSKMEDWRREVREHRDDDQCLILVLGNKCDLESRQVGKAQGREYSKENSATFYETSAKTGENVQESILNFIKQIHDYFVDRPDSDQEERGDVLSNTRKKNPSQNCCSIM